MYFKLEFKSRAKNFLKNHGAAELVAHTRMSLSHRRWRGRALGLISSVPLGNMKLDAATHYGDYILNDSWQYIVELFALERVDFVIRTLGEAEIARSSFADIGDSDGTFLRALGKDETSINYSQSVLANIRDVKKMEGCLPKIGLPDDSFDYVLLFETLEHLPDPIAGLREIDRLARKGAFVSIPYVKKTRVKPYWNNRRVPVGESHVFELSPGDFTKIATYTRFRVRDFRRVRVFATPRSFSEILFCAVSSLIEEQNVRCGAFRAFDVYYL